MCVCASASDGRGRQGRKGREFQADSTLRLPPGDLNNPVTQTLLLNEKAENFPPDTPLGGEKLPPGLPE